MILGDRAPTRLTVTAIVRYPHIVGSHAAHGGSAGRADRLALRKARRSRRRAQRRVPSPVPFAFMYGMTLETGWSNHASIGFYPISVLLWIAIIVASAAIDARAERRAAAWTEPRPRWHYLAFSGGYLIPVGAAALVLVALRGQPLAWWTNSGIEQAIASLVIFAVACCLLAALVMLGRAASWGRARRWFWHHPPSWLRPATAEVMLPG